MNPPSTPPNGAEHTSAAYGPDSWAAGCDKNGCPSAGTVSDAWGNWCEEHSASEAIDGPASCPECGHDAHAPRYCVMMTDDSRPCACGEPFNKPASRAVGAGDVPPEALDAVGEPDVSAEILDACCGGRMWWWDKAHPLAVYMDNREVALGALSGRPSWGIEPDMIGDFRAMPFTDGAFRLVLFDPPHIVRERPSGTIATQYGALRKESEQDDLRVGLSECWRVLGSGGTLIVKWAGSPDRIQPHFPAAPIVGTRWVGRANGLGTRWFVFYKPLNADAASVAA